jgi:DNA-directed RNA polymerase subunit RPC12/RpoP
MFSVSRRAFPRNNCAVKIIFSIHPSKKLFTANMYNDSEGGMYFESNFVLEPGTDLIIKRDDFDPIKHGSEALKGYRAEVVWCESVGRNGGSLYGVGVRFIMNVCSQCGKTVAYTDIQKTNAFLFLCPDCFRMLEAMRDGKMKNCIENYLIGNVI